MVSCPFKARGFMLFVPGEGIPPRAWGRGFRQPRHLPTWREEGRESERETDRREQSVNVAGLTAHLLQDSGIYNSTRFTNSTRFITPERQQPIRGKVCTRDQLETSCTASLFIILTSGLFFSFRVFLFCCCCCLFVYIYYLSERFPWHLRD